MHSNQRAVIEQLKAEQQHFKAVHEQLSRATDSSADAVEQQKIAQLKDLVQSYRSKAQTELQLLSQICQELERAKEQVLQLKKRQQGTATRDRASSPSSAAASRKSIVVLKERLSHQKQKLDETVSRNKALATEIEEYSKRGNAAKQLHLKLQRQLADATAEAERLQKHVAAVEEVQQQASVLAEQLRLQDDTEQLTFDAAGTQLAAVVEMVKQQQQQQEECLQTSWAAHCNAHSANADMPPDTAMEVLQQLMQLLQQAGHASCCQCDEAAVDRHTWKCYQHTVQRLVQLQADAKLQSKRCSLANMQLLQQQDQQVGSTGSSFMPTTRPTSGQ